MVQTYVCEPYAGFFVSRRCLIGLRRRLLVRRAIISYKTSAEHLSHVDGEEDRRSKPLRSGMQNIERRLLCGSVQGMRTERGQSGRFVT